MFYDGKILRRAEARFHDDRRRREEEFPRNAAAAICDLACGAPTA